MPKKQLLAPPDRVEREYTKELQSYAGQLARDVNRVLIPQLPRIVAEYKAEARVDAWTDSIDALINELVRLSLEGLAIVVAKLPGYFTATSTFNGKEFRAVVKANTGLDVPEARAFRPGSRLGINPFRTEPFLVPLAEGWVKENTSLIKSLPTRLHPEIEGIIRRGVMGGASVPELSSQIKERYGVTKYRATLIAQDQILKLNADLSEYRLKSIGVEEYTWRSVMDSRVRPEHADRNGKVYSWAKGPSGGLHPGKEVRCRCRAEPIFPDFDV